MASNIVKVDIEEIMEEIRAQIRREQAESVDVGQIMQEIRTQLKNSPPQAVPAFSEVTNVPVPASGATIADSKKVIPDDSAIVQQISNEAQYLKGSAYYPYYWEMGKGPKGFAKRVVRKLNKCILLPIHDHQNDFNLHTANGIDALRIGMDVQRQQIAAMDNSAVIRQLQQQVGLLSEQLEKNTQLLAMHGEVMGNLKDRISAHDGEMAIYREERTQQGNAIRAHDERLDDMQSDLKAHGDELAAHRDKLQSHEERLDVMGSDLKGHGDELAAHREELRSHEERLNVMGSDLKGHGDELAAHRMHLQSHDDRFEDHARRMDDVDRTIDEIGLSIARVIRHYMTADHGMSERPSVEVENVSEDKVQEIPAGGNTYESLDYFKFQNDFRGTQRQIMERQRSYLPYFRNKTGRIFDLGCGRGEFLRLLKEENIPAFGVDTYPEYEITGQMYGIEIGVGDGIEVLEKQKEPLGGIFCAQVIEHLGFKNVEKLCRLAYDKLEKGGCLILETPNPMCVSTMTNGFYIDPTHDKPVHPLLMQYMLKSIGFTEVQLLWPDHSLGTLPPIHSEYIDNLEEVNRAIERVSGLLFGSQDYAVIAKR